MIRRIPQKPTPILVLNLVGFVDFFSLSEFVTFKENILFTPNGFLLCAYFYTFEPPKSLGQLTHYHMPPVTCLIPFRLLPITNLATG